jgi:hypothetical protein
MEIKTKKKMKENCDDNLLLFVRTGMSIKIFLFFIFKR